MEGLERMDAWRADLGNGYYKNPILYTDYSDPDAIRVDDDYYMVASSFCNSPGVPLLHSKDLVNWRVINYVVEKLPGNRYEKPVHGCGAWAPSIRFYNGVFYVFVPMPDEGIFVCSTTDPWGEWSQPHFIFEGKGWIDPCPFWDEDGRAYMVNAFANSRIGFKSILQVTQMKPDCSELIGESRYIFDGNKNDQLTIEGPKFYKRNGYYYIFAPAGGVKTGWQTVLRSKNPFGPYDYRVVLRQGDTPVNGPHQGAWVDTQGGEDWFLHFQDVYAAGRIVHLQPMKWENDWPVIGEPVKGEEYGVPVSVYRKPQVKETYPPEYPVSSDEFDSLTLSLCWQWNANYHNEWFAMDPEGSCIILNAVKNNSASISDVPNLLLQKWCLPEFTADTVMDLDKLQNGDMAGMVSLGVTYGAVAVKKENDEYKIIKISGSQKFEKETAYAKDVIEEAEAFKDLKKIWFKNIVERTAPKEAGVPNEIISLYYSTDGEQFTKALEYEALAGRWVGVKNGVFAVSENFDGGSVSVDYFRIAPK